MYSWYYLNFLRTFKTINAPNFYPMRWHLILLNAESRRSNSVSFPSVFAEPTFDRANTAGVGFSLIHFFALPTQIPRIAPFVHRLFGWGFLFSRERERESLRVLVYQSIDNITSAFSFFTNLLFFERWEGTELSKRRRRRRTSSTLNCDKPQQNHTTQINHHYGPDPTWQTVSRSNGLPNYHHDGMHVGRIHVEFVLLVFGWYTHFVDAILQSASTTSIMAERDGRWYVSRDYGLFGVVWTCTTGSHHTKTIPLICCGGSKLCRVHYCRQHSL